MSGAIAPDDAGVVELADARDSKSRVRKDVRVQVPPPAPPPFSLRGAQREGLERARGAERLARKSTTHGSATATSPAAIAGAMVGRRLRRASPSFGTISSISLFARGLSLSSIQAPSETARKTGRKELRHHASTPTRIYSRNRT